MIGGAGVGTAVWLSSYAILGAIGLYKPIWEYDTETLKKDYTAHLTFGLAAGLAYRLLGAVQRS